LSAKAGYTMLAHHAQQSGNLRSIKNKFLFSLVVSSGPRHFSPAGQPSPVQFLCDYYSIPSQYYIPLRFCRITVRRKTARPFRGLVNGTMSQA